MTQPFALDLRHRPRILAGSSLGPESDAVVRAALQLVRAGGGRLHVAHALEPPPLPGGSIGFGLAAPHLAERARSAIREQLDRVGAVAGEVAGIDVEIGSAGAVLSAAAERMHADLIVVAPAAAAPLPLQRVGTTARRLLREGGRPVFIVKGEARIPPERVLAPIDLSPSAADSLRCGLAILAGEPSVDRLPELITLNVSGGGTGRPEGTRGEDEELTTFTERCTADYHGTVRREVREGDAVSEIVAAVERDRPDLVLMGTHGRSGWRRMRLGSVAEAVIERSPISLLVVPPDAAFGSALVEAVGRDIRHAS
jgi:nucleotide-binding universal stress UspA family protein